MPERMSSRLRAGFVVFCIGAFGLQLWLAAPDEVVASPNLYDQRRYLEMADHLARGEWLGRYGPLTLLRAPGYPAWVALVERSGMRLRTAAELLLAASAFVFAAALIRVGASAPTAAVAFAVLVLQPHAFLVNREVLPSGLYLPVLLLALAGLLLAVRSRRPLARSAHAAWAGLAFGLLHVTRPETFLIPVLVAGAAAAELVLRRGEPGRVRLRDAALLVCIPACVVFLVDAGISAANQRRYGARVVSEPRSSGYVAALRALHGVEQRAPRRFVPVPFDVRQRVYAASPAFRRLEPVLEGESWGRNVSCVQLRVCDDLSSSVFGWMLREAAAAGGRMPTAPAADAFFQRVADQIDAACARDELRCGGPRLALLPPYPHIWLPHLGGSLRRLAARIATAGEPGDRRPPRDDRLLPAALREHFDRVANRRSELTSDHWIEVRGWAESPDPVVRVELLHGARRSKMPVAARSAEAGAPARVDFAFRYEEPADPRRRRPRPKLELELERAGGSVERVSLARLERGPVEHDGLRVELDRVAPLEPASALRDRVREVLWSLHALWIRVLVLAGLAAAGVWIARRPRRRRGVAFGVAVILLAGAVGSRLLLLALVDASAFPGDNTRYLYPVIPLLSCLLLLVVDAALTGRRSTA